VNLLPILLTTRSIAGGGGGGVSGEKGRMGDTRSTRTKAIIIIIINVFLSKGRRFIRSSFCKTFFLVLCLAFEKQPVVTHHGSHK
jgi:hypothetical protein